MVNKDFECEDCIVIALRRIILLQVHQFWTSHSISSYSPTVSTHELQYRIIWNKNVKRQQKTWSLYMTYNWGVGAEEAGVIRPSALVLVFEFHSWYKFHANWVFLLCLLYLPCTRVQWASWRKMFYSSIWRVCSDNVSVGVSTRVL